MLSLFGWRATAYLIDSLLLLILVRPAQITQRFVGDLSPLTWFGLQLVAIAITTLYVVGCHARWGCTLGKLMCGLRVASLNGSIPPALKNAFLRFAPVMVLGNLDLVFATFAPASWRTDLFSREEWHINLWQTAALAWVCLDTLAALFTGARRSIHDFIGCTQVVRKA